MKLPLPFLHLAWSNLLAQSAEQISLAAVPLVAVLALGAGPAETGLLAAAQTLPFLLLSLPAGLLADRYSRRLLLVLGESLRVLSLLIGPLVSVAAGAVMAATLLAPPGLRAGLLAGLSFFLFGVGPIVWTITQMTLRQTVTPGAMLGRVSALFMTVSVGARPLGALLGGLVGELYGLPACILLAGLGFVAQAGVILWSAVPALARLPAIDDTDAERPAAAPA